MSTLKRLGFHVVLVLLVGVSIFSLQPPQNANAAPVTGFKAGRIMDDAVFTNERSMTASQIQSFLNSKVPDCDKWGEKPSEYGGGTRAQFGASQGYPPPYTCLKKYSQGGRSAAQIIYDAARANDINPQVLIVLLQKEQGLVTDDWPWSIQYRSATGYGCPDTAACDSDYYGFTNQVNRAADMFQAIMTNRSGWYTPYSLGNNQIYWNPDTGRCGSSTVNIQNRATVALYSYTPYRPNQAALDAGYGTGNSCSSYGNRNFYQYYKDWFGSVRWNIEWGASDTSVQAYTSSDLTGKFTKPAINLAPGGSAYIKVTVRNNGNKTWSDSTVRIGTKNQRDRASSFYDSATWVTAARPARLEESSVAPGSTGTFTFKIEAPNTLGQYRERFGFVSEGIAWLSGGSFTLDINVTQPRTAANTNYRLQSGEQLRRGDRLLSQDKHNVLILQHDGNLVYYSNSKVRWSTGTNKGYRLVMQSDGNLVLYKKNGTPIWHTGTNGDSGAYLTTQTDGNLVVYKNSTPLWYTGTTERPNLLNTVNPTLTGIFLPGQLLETPDRRFRLVLQTDGNLVLYSPNRATWASWTQNRDAAFLTMQGDGNLVLYSSSGRPIWHTRSNGKRGAFLTLQQDGNLVLYSRKGNPLWHTGTNGKE